MSAWWRDSNSFIDDVDENHGLFYAITEADLSEDTTLTLGFSHQKDKTNYFWGASMLGLDGHHLNLPRSYNPGTSWENKDQDVNTVFAELRHNLANDWKLQVNANYAEQNGLFSGSYQSRWNGPTLERTVWQASYDENQTGLDSFLSGPFQAFGRTHELVVGAGKRIYDMTTQNYDPYAMDWPITAGKPNFTRTDSVREVTTQDSVYATTRLSLADPLKLILGGRLDWYDYDNRDGDGDYKVTRNVTRYAGLIYELDQHHSVYASYTDIFQPQTYRDASGGYLDPVQGKSYELGLKGTAFGDTLAYDVAVFNYDYSDAELGALVAPLRETASLAGETHAIFNNNYGDQGQRNASTLQALLAGD